MLNTVEEVLLLAITLDVLAYRHIIKAFRCTQAIKWLRKHV